jgi:Fic family protein
MTDDVLEIFQNADEPVFTAVEIAEMADVSAPTANKRLKELEQSGQLHRKRVGSRAVVWWLAGGL